jgi:hypothetical protein|tara:strand:- start:4055 stop:4291 length:237 start_codon:yes stop_codon:yes gene_type:complete
VKLAAPLTKSQLNMAFNHPRQRSLAHGKIVSPLPQLAHSCADQVRKIRRILEELSMEIATPEEARIMLGLKGKDAVNF